MSLSTLTVKKEYDDGKVLSEAQLDAIKSSIESWASQIAARAPDKSDTQTISGVWTLTTPKITGAGAGLATLQYANSGSSRTLTIPADADDTFATLTATQTLTNKTLTSPTVTSPTISGTVAGGATYASPVISGTPTTANALGVSSNTLTIGNGTAAIKCLREDGATTDTDTAAEVLADNQATFTNVDGTNAAITFTVNAPGKYAVLFMFNAQIQDSAGGFRMTLAFRLNDGTNSSPEITCGSEVITNPHLIKFPLSIFHIFTFGSIGSKTVTLQYKTDQESGANTACTYNEQTDFASVCGMYAFRIAD